MDICLCCGLKLKGENLYHGSCLKKLFGTAKIPVINFASTGLLSEINKNIGKMSISGAQIKASIKLNREKNMIEITGSGGSHILKPEPGDYPGLCQNENLCMNIAESAGMEVPPHGLFYLADKKLCYIVKRFDRGENAEKIHVEDMAQLSEMPPDAKYESSLEKVGRLIIKYSRRPYIDIVYFIERVIFCFLTGNGDMHLKNWSLISVKEKDYAGYQLSPCYDLLCSKIYLPDEDESALTINGKRNRISKDDFFALSQYLKVDNKAYENAFSRIKGLKKIFLELIDNAVYFDRRDKLKEIFNKNYKRLFDRTVT